MDGSTTSSDVLLPFSIFQVVKCALWTDCIHSSLFGCGPAMSDASVRLLLSRAANPPKHRWTTWAGTCTGPGLDTARMLPQVPHVIQDIEKSAVTVFPVSTNHDGALAVEDAGI
jgi:hypothetical protein